SIGEDQVLCLLNFDGVGVSPGGILLLGLQRVNVPVAHANELAFDAHVVLDGHLINPSRCRGIFDAQADLGTGVVRPAAAEDSAPAILHDKIARLLCAGTGSAACTTTTTGRRVGATRRAATSAASTKSAPDKRYIIQH